MSGIEYAAGRGAPARSSPFPSEWVARQAPPADAVGLAAWIASNVRGARPLLPGLEVRDTPAARRTLSGRQALLALAAKRTVYLGEGPFEPATPAAAEGSPWQRTPAVDPASVAAINAVFKLGLKPYEDVLDEQEQLKQPPSSAKKAKTVATLTGPQALVALLAQDVVDKQEALTQPPSTTITEPLTGSEALVALLEREDGPA